MSYEVVMERVPVLDRRESDRVIAGSNNSVIVLGTDRPGGSKTGYGKGSGTVHVIAGLNGSDPSMSDDRAFLYVSAKTDPDKNLSITAEGIESEASTVIAKADTIRLVGRRNVKIFLSDTAYIHIDANGSVVLEGDIKLGRIATQHLVLGEAFLALFNAHTHPQTVPPTAITGPPVPLMTNLQLTQRVRGL